MKPPQGWLPPTAAYYVLPDPQRVECGPLYGSQPMAESMMQAWVGNLISDPSGFIWGANGSGDQTPRSLLDQAIAMATQLTERPCALFTCAGFDAIERAVFYTYQLFDILKRIPATTVNGLFSPNDSVFDMWVVKKK